MRTICLISFAVGACYTSIVHAQTAPDDTIVVTATGRPSALSRVPDTVTVFDSTQIRERRLTTLDDILGVTPGVLLIANDQDPGTNLISVRGVSANRGQEPSVAFVVDDEPLPDLELFTLRPFDLARVEILKGPQGALLGRSASGGAIVYTTASTTDPGYVSLGYGNGQSLVAESALSVPLLPHVTVRISSSFLETDGFIRNSFLNRLVDDFSSRNIRVKAEWAVSDAITLNARLGYAHENAGAANVVIGEFTQSTQGLLDPALLVEPFGDFPGRASRTWLGGQASLKAQLGNGDVFKVFVAYDHYTKDFIEELDFLNVKPVTFFGEPVFPNGIQPIRQPVGLKSWTLETRYISDADRTLRWFSGVFVQNNVRDRTDDFEGFGLTPQFYRTFSTQIGLFGQVQTHLAQTVELTAGLRYDRDNRRQRLTDVASQSIVDMRGDVFSAWQPKLSLAWTPTAHTTTYITASVGFKSGGFNPLPVPTDPPYALTFPAERTKALEVGVKSSLLAGRVDVSLAGYATRLNNFQNTVFLTNNVVFSVPKVAIYGFEGAITAHLTEALTWDVSGAYTDARVRQYEAPNPTPEPGEADRVNYQDRFLVNAPQDTLTTGITWKTTIAAAQVTSRVEYVRLGTVYYELDNILHTPPRSSVNGQVSVAMGPLSLSFWVKNAFNTRWATSAYGQQQLALLLYLGPGGPYDSYTINPGRQWGGTVRWDF